MWFLLRIMFAGLIAVLRYRWINQSIDDSESWRNDIYYRRGDRPGDIHWGLGFDRPLIFELLLERRSDRWLKSIGLLVEQQTGDRAFDDRVYIRGDQPILGQFLSSDPATRAEITTLLDLGVKRIYCDGVRLWVKDYSPLASKHEVFLALRTLRSRLLTIHPEAILRIPNPITWRIATVEAFVWGLAVYAATGLVELIRAGEFSHEITRLMPYAFGACLLAVVSSAGFIGVLVRRSSFAKTVIWEACLVLVLAVPIASVALVLDANSFLDRAPRNSSHYQIVERSARHYYRFGRGSYVPVVDYLVRVSPQKTGDPAINRWLIVPRETHDDKSAALLVVWGVGALGLPWIESSRPVAGTASSTNHD